MLLSNDSRLATELDKSYDSEGRKEDSLSRSKRFAVVVLLHPALIYGAITGTMAVAVGVGASQVVRAIDAAASSTKVEESDCGSQHHSDYDAESEVWQAVDSKSYRYDYDSDSQDSVNTDGQTEDLDRHWEEVYRKRRSPIDIHHVIINSYNDSLEISLLIFPQQS